MAQIKKRACVSNGEVFCTGIRHLVSQINRRKISSTHRASITIQNIGPSSRIFPEASRRRKRREEVTFANH